MLTTTTGFHSDDFEAWRLVAPAVTPLLLMVMFAGAMGRLTNGGVKTARWLIGVKAVRNSLYHLVHSRALTRTRINGEVLPEDRRNTMVAFLLLYVLVYAMAVTVITALGLDEVSALSSVAACMNNIGPSLGLIGPLSNYAAIPTVGKWVLIAVMLIGRLELCTLLILLTPAFWRR